MLDLRLLRNRMFRQCNLVSLFSIGSFLGRHVRDAVVPATAARHVAVGQRPDDVSAGVRRDGVVADRRPGLRARRTAPVDGRRLLRRRFDHRHVHADRDRHEAVVDPRPDVLPRRVHGIRVRADAGGELRDDQAGGERAGLSIFSTQRQIGISLGVAIMASILGAHMSLDRVHGAGADPARSTGVDGFLGVRRRRADGLDRRCSPCCSSTTRMRRARWWPGGRRVRARREAREAIAAQLSWPV